METIPEEEALTNRMTTRTPVHTPSGIPPKADFSPVRGRWLQRKCACGGMPGATGECAECKRKRLALQPKLRINRPNDRFEEEADRAAAAVVSGRSVTAGARANSPRLQRQEATEKKREQPTQFPVEEQPKEGQAKDDDEKEKLKTGGLKVAEQLGKYLWDQFSNSAAGKSVLAANERDLKPMLKFFEDFADTLGGKVALGALGTGAVAGAMAGAWATREPAPDPAAAPAPTAPPSRAPKDEKFFALELKWDFVSPPSGLTVKTPWLDLPEIPLGSQPPAANPALPPPPVLFKAVPKIPRVCTPSDPQGDQGEADARSAFIYWWLKHNQEMAEKKQQEIIENSQPRPSTTPPTYSPSLVKPLFKREPGAEAIEDPAAIEAGLRSSGQPLDAATRNLMESRFGYNFSQVRVHADAKAAESARAINARAYATGHNIVFAAGEFAPHTGAGEKLLAHELAHVVQQSSAAGFGAPGLDSLDIGPAGGNAESKADRMAAGGSFAARGRIGSLIQRQMEGAPPAMNLPEQGLEGAEKLGGDCTTGCAALESMRNSVKHLCELAGERDRRCIEGRKKLAAAEGKIIGMGCKCAMPIV